MSYVLAGLGAELVPAPEPTATALSLLGRSAAVCAPIALGVGAGVYLDKKKGALLPIGGALVGALISTLWLRSGVQSGTTPLLLRPR